MNYSLKTLVPEHALQNRILSLAHEIADDYRKDEIVLIGLLNGCFLFLADLVRHFYNHHIPLRIDFMRVSSYGSHTKSNRKPKLIQDLSFSVKDQHVLVVDDILDTGHTLHHIHQRIGSMHPKSIKSCVCLDKPDRREIQIQAEYVGFTVPNEFLVGYGLDHNGRFREMPYIATITLDQ